MSNPKLADSTMNAARHLAGKPSAGSHAGSKNSSRQDASGAASSSTTSVTSNSNMGDSTVNAFRHMAAEQTPQSATNAALPALMRLQDVQRQIQEFHTLLGQSYERLTDQAGQSNVQNGSHDHEMPDLAAKLQERQQKWQEALQQIDELEEEIADEQSAIVAKQHRQPSVMNRVATACLVLVLVFAVLLVAAFGLAETRLAKSMYRPVLPPF